MGQASWVLAVVDSVDGVAVVWWVNLGRGLGMSRLSGAWVLDTDELRRKLPALIATRMVLATEAGQSALNDWDVRRGPVVDATATLAAVVAVRDELQAGYERKSTAKNGRSLVPPRWPTLLEPLDVERAAVPAGDDRASRVLAIARWFVWLCEAWDGVEQQRRARSYLRSLGGETARLLPVVAVSSQPTVPT